MDKKSLLSQCVQVAAGLAVLVFAHVSFAAPILCGINSTQGATANGAYADDCHYVATNLSNPAAITQHTNSLWGNEGEFRFIGKNDEVGVSGFVLSVTGSSDGLKYGYTLHAPGSWLGATVDWVLGVKQANNSYVSYLFKDVVLGIDGGFNNFWLNPAGKEKQDFSFVAGFIRESSTVSEPGVIVLMLTGVFGLIASRRRSMRRR